MSGILKALLDIRQVLLVMLWNSLPAEASDDWQREQLKRAGANKKERAVITGDKE